MEPVATYEWIVVYRHNPPKRQTTFRYAVHNRKSGEIIGWVRWYGPWRQQVLFPEPDTVWSAGCLRDVCDFIGGDRR